jgi:hypothetical protein
MEKKTVEIVTGSVSLKYLTSGTELSNASLNVHMNLLFLLLVARFISFLKIYLRGNVKGKAIPLQAWAGPEGSRRLRLPDFKTIGA